MALALSLMVPGLVPAQPASARHLGQRERAPLASPARFRRDMPGQIRAGHPEARPVAEAIRRLSADPLEQLALVQQSTRLLVEYDSDRRVYGRRERHATLDEMAEQRDRAGWAYLRDDCDGRAVFAAHVLADLGLDWRLEASSLKRHAWVSVRVGTIRYDLLDLSAKDPELQNLLYRGIGRWILRASTPPPRCNLREIWRERAGADPVLGRRLGLLHARSGSGGVQPRFAVNWLKREPGLADAAGAKAGAAAAEGPPTPRDDDSDPRAGARSGRSAVR